MKFSSLVTVLAISAVLPTSAETGKLKRLTNVIDSYPQLSKDGKTLTYVTTANGQRMPTIKISRVYTLAPPKAAG